MVETMAGGLAVFDYDADGLPDIYFTNGASIPSLRKENPGHWNRLFHNDGGLTFTDVTESAGVRADGYTTGAAAGDFDNDGRIDLFVAGVQRNHLFRNLGDGRFEDVTARSGMTHYTWSVAAGWFDYDNDGWLDLFVVNYVDWTPEGNKFCGDRARNCASTAIRVNTRGFRTRFIATGATAPSRTCQQVRHCEAHRQGHERRLRRLRRLTDSATCS